MKLIATAVLVLLAAAYPVQAQSGGYISVVSDHPGWADCSLVETVGSVISLYVVHTTFPEATSSRLRVVHNWTATQLPTDYHGNTVVGDIYTGLQVWYPDYFDPSIDGCAALPALIAELRFMPVTPTPPCTVTFQAAPHPASVTGFIDVIDCHDNLLAGLPGTVLIVNGGDSCPCFGDPPPVAAETTTWGAIKSLYQ